MARRSSTLSEDILRRLPDPDASASLARQIAEHLSPGDTVLMYGGIGAGKTHIARAIIRHLTTPDHDVPSPTFTLVQSYDTAQGPLWHMDLYRLGDPDELAELGLDEILDDGICLIEWPERLGALMPRRHLALYLEQDGAGRVARIAPIGGGWDSVVRGVGA